MTIPQGSQQNFPGKVWGHKHFGSAPVYLRSHSCPAKPQHTLNTLKKECVKSHAGPVSAPAAGRWQKQLSHCAQPLPRPLGHTPYGVSARAGGPGPEPPGEARLQCPQHTLPRLSDCATSSFFPSVPRRQKCGQDLKKRYHASLWLGREM